jgi:hypothetical protein
MMERLFIDLQVPCTSGHTMSALNDLLNAYDNMDSSYARANLMITCKCLPNSIMRARTRDQTAQQLN